MTSIAWDYLSDLQKAQVAQLRPDIYSGIEQDSKQEKHRDCGGSIFRDGKYWRCLRCHQEGTAELEATRR